MARREHDSSEYSDGDMGDDSSVVIDIDDPRNPTIAANDEEFENECGYFIVKMLRGSTLGRKIKREVFKITVNESIFGISMFLISCYENIGNKQTMYTSYQE